MNRGQTGAPLALCRLTPALPVKAAIAAKCLPDPFPASDIDGLMRNADPCPVTMVLEHRLSFRSSWPGTSLFRQTARPNTEVSHIPLIFGVASFFLMALLLGNRLIRNSLAAPRVAEIGAPEGLPWQSVKFPTVRGKTLFGWFIPAAEGAPALAVIHGWGGNAEMMLPMAKLLHMAGYSLLLFDARNHGGSDTDDFASLPRVTSRPVSDGLTQANGG